MAERTPGEGRVVGDEDNVGVALTHYQASTYPLLRRLDQQFALEAKFADYQYEVSRVNDFNKAALSSLGSQERRLREMQASLRSSLALSDGIDHGRLSCDEFTEGPKRGSRASAVSSNRRQSMIVAEEVMIGQTTIPNQEAAEVVSARIVTTKMPLAYIRGASLVQKQGLPTAVPDAPANFHVTGIRKDSFAVVWDVVKTEASIVDYELRYTFDVAGTETQVLQRCSRWLLKDPVPNGRFVVQNLKPSTEYRDIAIRCRNSAGWSGFTSPITVSTVHVDDDYEHRRRKFLYRIGHIKDSIKSLEAARQQIPAEQVLLARKMSHTQDERMLALHEEIERVASHNDDELLSSHLLHGASQIFTKRTLQRKLEQELVVCRESIATWRAEIIDLDKESSELAAEIQEKQSQLGERKAALLQFDKRHSIVSSMKCVVSKQPLEMKQYYIALWKSRVADRLDVRKTINSLARFCRRRILNDAWRRLSSVVTSRHANVRSGPAEEKPTIGIGGKLLNTAESCVEGNLAAATHLILSIHDIQGRQDDEVAVEARPPTHLLSKEDQDTLAKGNFLFGAGHYQPSLMSFETVLSTIEDPTFFSDMSPADAASLYADVNGKIGNVHIKLGSFDLAIQYFGRQLSLAEEEDLQSPRASALLGLGMCYHAKNDYGYAEGLLNRALELFVDRGDEEHEAVCYEYLRKCCDCLNRPKEASDYAAKIQSMDVTSWERDSGGTAISRKAVDNALDHLDSLRGRLINLTAKESRVVRLEVASAHRVQLQRARAKKEEALKGAYDQLSASAQSSEELRDLLEQIEDELEEAKRTKTKNLVSSLIHGNSQELKAAELKLRLEQEKSVVELKLKECLAEIPKTEMLIRNTKDDIHVLNEELDVESGPLMHRILEGRQYRCISLNASNLACSDITGMSSSGVAQVAVSEGNNIYIHSLETGELTNVFISGGDDNTATISSLFFRGHRVYAGTMDSMVVGWDISTSEKHFAGKGHEASVTCIHADDSKVVSGSADQNIIIWSIDGAMIRSIGGHARGVHCIQCGPSWCISASYSTVFVWSLRLDDETDKIKGADCRRRLVLPNDANVSSLQYGELEVITGDNLGLISVWWIESGELLQSFKAHGAPVSSLQVDATKAISGSLDHTIAISDIIRGEILHKLRGHSAPVLAVAFDKTQIVSLSSDGEMRYWSLGGPARRAKKYRESKVNAAQRKSAAQVVEDFVSIEQALPSRTTAGDELCANKGTLMNRLARKFPAWRGAETKRATLS